MKKHLLVTAALALALAAPSMASAAEGFADLTYFDADDLNVDALTLGGAWVTEAGRMNVQLDGSVSRVSAADDVTTVDAAAHLFTRNDSWSLGGFVAAGSVGDDVLSFGFEGAKYWNRATLSARVSSVDANSSFFDNLTVLEAGLTFFPTDNLSLGLSVANLDTDAGFEDDLLGAHVEWKTSGPVSFFADYESFNDANVDTLNLGLRWHFGAGSLKDRDRSGPSMRRASSLWHSL